MKPIVFYVDDEPHNLTIFEASMPEDWDVRVFSNPLLAIEQISDVKPWVVISDQRMPGMTGIKFLELVGKLSPETLKIITTGYSDENLIIESIRTAQVLDYIVKPWDPDDLSIRLKRAVDLYKEREQRKALELELKNRETELRLQNEKLSKMTTELEALMKKEESYRKELQSWVPPIVIWATENNVKFPLKKDLIVMAIDIIGSAGFHGVRIGQHSVREKALLEFTQLVLKHGGYVESTEGDSAYAHFGLMNTAGNPADAASAVATEFRAALRGIGTHHKVEIECGIGIHLAKNCDAFVHEYTVMTPNGLINQKKFDTSSIDIDLVHRMEKLTHKLPGSNIVITKDLFSTMTSRFPVERTVEIGNHMFKGQPTSVELVLIRSDRSSDADVQRIIAEAVSLKAAG
jgi:FixJ family two-component response regulator/class 3 adenylate cyclase